MPSLTPFLFTLLDLLLLAFVHAALRHYFLLLSVLFRLWTCVERILLIAVVVAHSILNIIYLKNTLLHLYYILFNRP
jgi:hypothetical protein